MNWNILEIGPTKDKKEISRAYRSQLVEVNPEDKPEEFKQLRAAYEEALSLADQEEKPETKKTPVELWAEKLAALYNDFPRRIDPACWKELLSEDVCIALGSRSQAESALVQFLMQKYYLPQSVWLVLDEEFDFFRRASELYENYPHEFVDYVILDGIRYSDDPPYKLYTPGENGEDCDAYRKLYLKAGRVSYEEATPLLEEMDYLSEHHPYGDALRLQISLFHGDTGCIADLIALSKNYPDDLHLTLEAASALVQHKDWAEGEALSRRALELFPQHGRATWLLAQCLAGQGKYSDAIDLVSDLMTAANGDQKQLHQLNQVRTNWNEALIEEYENKLVSDGMDPSALEPYVYHNLFGQIHNSLNEYEAALEHCDALIAVIKDMKPDGTEKTDKRIGTLPERVFAKAGLLYQLGRKEEAIATYEESLRIAPENGEILTYLLRFYLSVRNYERAAELGEQLTKLIPDAYHTYLLYALALFGLHRDRDAFDAVNHAMDIDRGDLGEYTLKMQILIRNGAYEEARNIVNFLHENEINDATDLLWCEAMLAELDEKNKEKALESYNALAQRLEAGESPSWAADLYFRITSLKAEGLDMSKQEDRDVLMELLEKGLSYDPEDGSCLDYKAWLLKKDGKKEEALKIYHTLEARPRRNLYIERQLAEVYYSDLEKYADKSLHYYQILLDDSENDPDFLFYVGMCQMQLGNFADAEKMFLAEQGQEPDVLDGYYRLSYVYEATGRLEEALIQAEKALEIVKDREGNQTAYYLRKVQILRRLGRPHEAVAVVREAMDKYGYSGGNEKIYDIYAQFGLWDDAEKHIKKWRRQKDGRSSAVAVWIKTSIRKDKQVEAWLKRDNYSLILDQPDTEDINLLAAKIGGKSRTINKILQDRLKKVADDNIGGLNYAYMNLAIAAFREGNIKKAKEYAQKGLEACDEVLKGHLRDEAMYRARRSLLLAILGRKEEAINELAVARNLPLCISCPYGRCKDADIYEMDMAELFGDPEKSLEMAKKGMKDWPDDEDFVIQLHHLKRKGLKS